jgi:ATP-dependent exoDNAse (exonuclease V) beta subunit
LVDKENHRVPGDKALVYRFGDPDFRNPKEKTDEGKVETMTDSVASDWLRKIKVDPNPTLFWQSKDDAMQPREWGELVHQILAKIRGIEEADTVLLPYLHDGVIDLETAGALKDKFLQMAQHPLISGAFSSEAKVKTECEIYYPAIKKVIRLDRYAELPDVIYLIDYKTGKKDPEHHTQVQHYANAVKELSGKEIRAYLVYLSEDAIEVEPLIVNAL